MYDSVYLPLNKRLQQIQNGIAKFSLAQD